MLPDLNTKEISLKNSVPLGMRKKKGKTSILIELIRLLLNLRRKIHVMSGQGKIWTQAKRWAWVIAQVKISTITAYTQYNQGTSLSSLLPCCLTSELSLFFFFPWWPTCILIFTQTEWLHYCCLMYKVSALLIPQSSIRDNFQAVLFTTHL